MPLNICDFFSPGSQRLLRVNLLFGNDSALPAALGTIHTEELSGESFTNGGS